MREYLFHYEIKNIVRVYDGDTIKCWVAKDEDELKYVTLRLLDINTPEINNKVQHAAAIIARDYVISRLGETFVTDDLLSYWGHKRDSFGRILSKVYVGYDNINQELLDKGLAVPYDSSRQVRYL